LLFQRGNFRTVANLDIRIVGIVVSVVLMVILGAIEGLERRNLGHNRLRENRKSFSEKAAAADSFA